MNRKTQIYTILGSMILGAGFAILLNGTVAASLDSGGKAIYDEPYIGTMHPHIVSEGPGECEICGMPLSKLEGHKPGTPMPPLINIYASPDNPIFVHEGPGKDPETGSDLIPITRSKFYEAPEVHEKAHKGAKEEHKLQVDESGLYTCGMHPDVIHEGPGSCPICGMDLTPLKGSGGKSRSGERRIAYWVAPMDPNYISDEPGKSPMGMDLVPVYEDELKEGVISIDPVTLQNIGVVTNSAELRDLGVELRTNGTVEVAENAEYRINPKFSGWIEKLYVSRTGDLVQAGEALLEIYSPELVSAQEEYLLALKSSRMLAESDLERVKRGAGDLLTAARRRLELWDIDAKQIDELERTGKVKRTLTLYSPAKGIVLHKNAIAGAAVKAGMDLFHIADLSTVWVEAQVFEYELPWIREGASVRVESPYDPSLALTGRVDYVYPYLDAKTRTARVRIVIPNPRLDLRPDMYVDVRIEERSAMDAVTVPKSSVLRSGKRDVVFLALGEGRFVPREVKLGLESGDMFEIVDGLAAGMNVVTSAQFLLDSEAKLQEAIQRRLQARMNRKAG